MWRSSRRLLALSLVAIGCGRTASAPKEMVATNGVVADAGPDAAPDVALVPAQLDPDGDDDAQELGQGTLPTRLHPVKVGTPPLAHKRICDLSSFQGALYAAHAVAPLGIDGATITKYASGASTAFSVAFDWNRYGEPSKGGGAGQGFLRVHAIDGRLYVPDADPPYDGFGYLDHGTEGYVFVSDAAGAFAKALGEHRKPPLFPGPGREGRAGAMVLPRAYHVLDAIKFRGALYASTGSVPPKERAWSGPSPGALHRGDDAGTRLDYVVGYPEDAHADVWRLTFLVRFKDRLYAGLQEYYPRDPNDYVVFTPKAGSTGISPEDMHAVRATESGGVSTLRWYADRKEGALYWIAALRISGLVQLRVTHDGDTWDVIRFPEEAGQPTDVVRFRDALVVLTEHGLYRLEGTKAIELGWWDDGALFGVSDFFCAAPLAVHDGQLYAGAQNGGALYRFE